MILAERYMCHYAIIQKMNRKLIEKTDALLSKETGTIFKDPGGRISVCLVYPNTYYVGMSNLGFQGIYGLLNRRDDVVCERAFLPDEKDLAEYGRTGTPVFSFESKRPLHMFDIIAFSISFENDYPNILKILELSKIPFLTSERNKYHPLLIAGGVCCFFNPEPVSEIFDIVFVGEAEESLDEFMDIFREQKAEDRRQIKERMKDIEGLYIPDLYRVEYNTDGTISRRTAINGAPEKIKRTHLKDLSASGITTSIVTPEAEFSDMYLVEAMRGCPWNCRFCLVGQIYSPPRKKSLEDIKAEIERAKGFTENRDTSLFLPKKGDVSLFSTRIGLIGPSLTDYPHIMDVLCIDGVDFSITSLRASARSAELVGLLKGRKSVSIAPEAGTGRLRKVINKKITEKDILDTSELIFNAGIENLRLYFMIGLPSENEEDISGIVELVRKVRSLSERGNIILSVSTFVPKPFTPFQWCRMAPLSYVKEKLRFIKKAVKDMKGVKIFHDVPKYAHMQGVLSRGDRRVLRTIEAMARTDDWSRACAETGLDIDFHVFRERGQEEVLPWDFIDTGITKEKLWDEYMKSGTGD